MIFLRVFSMQDTEIDASEEDLPANWVKKQRKNGTVYYHNVLTDTVRDMSPNEFAGQPPGPAATATEVASHGGGVGRFFQVR